MICFHRIGAVVLSQMYLLRSSFTRIVTSVIAGSSSRPPLVSQRKPPGETRRGASFNHA